MLRKTIKRLERHFKSSNVHGCLSLVHFDFKNRVQKSKQDSSAYLGIPLRYLDWIASFSYWCWNTISQADLLQPISSCYIHAILQNGKIKNINKRKNILPGTNNKNTLKNASNDSFLTYPFYSNSL